MGASRIANVTAAVLVGFGSSPSPTLKRYSAALADLVEALFDDVLWVGERSPDGARGRGVPVAAGRRDPVVWVAAAIEAAGSERVIVFAEADQGHVGAELLLALVAWPESAAVWVADSEVSRPVCAIYRREDLLAAARRVLAGPDSLASLEDLVAGLEVERVTLARLGLDGGPHPLFAGRAWHEAC